MEQFLNTITKVQNPNYFIIWNFFLRILRLYNFQTCLPYIFPKYRSMFYSHRASRTRIKDLWESLHAADTFSAFGAFPIYHGVQWRQLGLDPAGFKRRYRMKALTPCLALHKYKPAHNTNSVWRRKTALSPRHSFCKHVCILGGMPARIRRGVASMHNARCWYWTRATLATELRNAHHGKLVPRQCANPLSLCLSLWSGFRFDP